MQQDRKGALSEGGTEDLAQQSQEVSEDDDESEGEASDDSVYFGMMEEQGVGLDPRARVLNVQELEALFTEAAPDLSYTPFFRPHVMPTPLRLYMLYQYSKTETGVSQTSP